MSRSGHRADRERKRSVDAMAVLTIAAMFVAVAIPWFIGRVDIDLAAAARWAFALSAIYLTVAMAVDRWGTPGVTRAALNAAPVVAAIMTVVLWHACGGIGRPALLGFLLLPVLSAAFIPARWPTVATAAVAILGAAVASVIEAPALGWYLSQTGLPTGWIMRFAAAATTLPAPAPPAELYATIVVATVAIVAVAIAGRQLRHSVRRAVEIAAGGAREEGEPLLERAFRNVPIPTAVITADTAQIVEVSDSFFQQMLLSPTTAVRSEFSQVVDLDDPDGLLNAVASGGRIDFVRYRVGAEERVASIAVERFSHAGSDFAAVTIRDWNDVGYLAVAADSVEEPLLLIGTNDGRLRYANRAANAAFRDLYVGRDMSWLEQSSEVRTRIPVRLFDSEPAMLLAVAPKAAGA